MPWDVSYRSYARRTSAIGKPSCNQIRMFSLYLWLLCLLPGEASIKKLQTCLLDVVKMAPKVVTLQTGS